MKIAILSRDGTLYSCKRLREAAMRRGHLVEILDPLLGSYPLNESVAITRARDKLRSLQLLARQGIDLPITGIAHSPDDTSDLIKMVGGAPLVVKLVEGTQGIGVVLAETRQAAESVIDAFRGLNAHILVQEYIAEAKGCDIRCLVVGNEVGAGAPIFIVAGWPASRRSRPVNGISPSKPHRRWGWMGRGRGE